MMVFSFDGQTNKQDKTNTHYKINFFALHVILVLGLNWIHGSWSDAKQILLN